jgi:hypothetical protein
MFSRVEGAAVFGAAPADHFTQLLRNAAPSQVSHRNETARLVEFPAYGMKLAIRHDCRKPKPFKIPDFLFELHGEIVGPR